MAAANESKENGFSSLTVWKIRDQSICIERGGGRRVISCVIKGSLIHYLLLNILASPVHKLSIVSKEIAGRGGGDGGGEA